LGINNARRRQTGILVALHDGTELKLSRSYRQKVEASLGQSL
jgi:hypothetical protein